MVGRIAISKSAAALPKKPRVGRFQLVEMRKLGIPEPVLAHSLQRLVTLTSSRLSGKNGKQVEISMSDGTVVVTTIVSPGPRAEEEIEPADIAPLDDER